MAEPRKAAESLPAERLVSAVRAGVRHAANNPYLGATLIRVLAFFPFASAYLALLPLLARHLISGGPQIYGILLAAIGVGTVGGSLIMRWLKDELGPDRLVAAGSLGAAFALVLFGLAHDPITAVSACLLAGASWTVVLTKLYVSAQVALPDWARGRGLAVFLTFIFGATTVGSAVWGKLSAMEGLPIAYFVAAAGVVLAIPMTWRWKLQTGVGIDFSPAAHWRAPIVVRKVENNQGPVLAVVEYRVDATNRPSSWARSTNLDTRESATGPMRGEFMKTSPTADASSRPSRSNPGSRFCISASGRPTPTRCSAAGFAICSRKRRASHSASPRSARTGLGESAGGSAIGRS